MNPFKTSGSALHSAARISAVSLSSPKICPHNFEYKYNPRSKYVSPEADLSIGGTSWVNQKTQELGVPVDKSSSTGRD